MWANAAGDENSRFLSSRVTKSAAVRAVLGAGVLAAQLGVAGQLGVGFALVVGVADLDRDDLALGEPRRAIGVAGPARRAART